MPPQDGLRFLFDIQDKISAKLAKIEAKSKASAAKIDKAFTRASQSQQANAAKAVASEQRRIIAVEKSHARAIAMLKRESDAFKRSMGRMAAAATVAFAAVAGKAIQMAGGYDAAMRSVQAKTGATGDLMDRLSEQSREMGRTTVHSATEAARGQAFLAQAGFDANEILEALPATLALATAGELDLASAADIASNVLQGFRLETAETGRVTDVLAAIAAKTNTSVSQMGVALAKAAPAAASAGWSLEQTAAAIGRLSDAGIQGEEAGTVLKTMLARLAAPTGKLAQLMTATGISVKNATGRMLPLNDIIAQLAPHADNTGLMFELLGTRGANAGLILGSLASDDLHNLTSELENSEGAAQRMADTMSGGLWGSIKEIQSIIESAYISLGERFTPAVKTLAAVFKKLPSPIQEVTVVVGSLAVAMGGLMVMMPGVFGALTTLPGKLLAVTKAFGALNLMMLANPFVLMAAGLALAGVALYKFREQLGLVGPAAAESIGEAEERVRSLATKVENSSGHMRRNLTRDLAAARAELGKLQTAEQDAGWAAFVASEQTRVLADALEDDVGPAAASAAEEVAGLNLEFDRFKQGSAGSQNSMMAFIGALQPLPPLGIEAAMAMRGLNLEFDRFPGGTINSQNALMGFIGTLQVLPGMAAPAGTAAAEGFFDGMSDTFARSFAGGGGFLGGVQSVMTQGWGKLFVGEGEAQATGFLGKMQSVMGLLGGVPLVGPLLAAFGPALLAGLGKLSGKVWSAIKGLFGGPDAQEQAGREAARLAERQLSAVITVTDEMIGRHVKDKIHIAIRDAQIAVGKSAAFAEQMGADMVRALWRAEKEGGAAVESVKQAILDLLKPQQDVVDGAVKMGQAFKTAEDAMAIQHAVTLQNMAQATKKSVVDQISYLGQLAGAAVGGGTVGGESSYNKHAAGFGHLTDQQDFVRRNPGDDHRWGDARGRASGGPVGAGRPYMVGERGPELFVPSRSGRIEPNGSSGGGVDAKALAKAVADALQGTRVDVDGRQLGRLVVRHQPLAAAELGGRR